MKIIYPHLQKLLPKLRANPKDTGNQLTMIGHFMDGFTVIKNEPVISLEVRQNRGDALSYYGIAKELSVLHQIPVRTPTTSLPQSTENFNLPIEIKAVKDVKRVLALRISNVSVKDSPAWLREFLEKHEINSINNIVDLTNYIMLFYGIPCHAFDTAITGNNLIWENNNKYKEFTTLDGSVLKLDNNMLIVSNEHEPLSISFIGGQNSGIKPTTSEIIIEMAVYNRSRVRNDSRKLKTITEASIRLDKELDTELIPQSFSYLVSLIMEYADGKITSNLYDKYINKPTPTIIQFNPAKPSAYAGITIPKDFALNTLKFLGCQLETTSDSEYSVTTPTGRKDLSIEEDLIEEVIRFYGYDKIPLDKPLSPKSFPDITPNILYLCDSIKNILSSFGYDEIRSWPLVKPSSLITDFNPSNSKPIYTENSINSEFPVLRSSLISSLLGQKDYYNRFKLPIQQFFEIGKIYYQQKDKYVEKYSLSIHHPNSKKLLEDYDILLNKLKIPKTKPHIYQNYLEIILNDIVELVDVEHLKSQNLFRSSQHQNTNPYELTKQIISLDANVNFDSPQEPQKLYHQYLNKIDSNILWQMDIIDIYNNPKDNTYRYTFRVHYFDTDDKQAKSLHLKVFGLQN